MVRSMVQLVQRAPFQWRQDNIHPHHSNPRKEYCNIYGKGVIGLHFMANKYNIISTKYIYIPFFLGGFSFQFHFSEPSGRHVCVCVKLKTMFHQDQRSLRICSQLLRVCEAGATMNVRSRRSTSKSSVHKMFGSHLICPCSKINFPSKESPEGI